MRHPKRPFVRSILFAGLALASISLSAPAFSQATIEYFTENGSNPPPFALTWFSGGEVSGSWRTVTDPNSLEGLQYQTFTSLSGTRGYWGMTFVSQRNLSAYAGGQLRFLLASNESLAIQMESGASTQIAVNIPSTGGQWKEIAIDLNEWVSQGINLSALRVPFMIRRIGFPPGQTTWYVDHIRWIKPLVRIELVPASTWHTSGRHRQYTAIGRDAAGEEAIIYADWTVSGAGNTISPAINSRYTILTIGNNAGNLSARTVTMFTGATVTSPNTPIAPAAAQDEAFGLLSESIAGALIGTDAVFGEYNGAGSSIVTADEISDIREGSKATRATLSVVGGSFAGFFVQHGVNPAESVVKNMAGYYDGSVRFWLKAPPGLAGKLELTIRTGGVTPGNELSRVTLGASHGATFDNQWRPVVVPLAQLAKAVPFADLSRMKILFNMAVRQDTGGSQTFYVDNVRWDTRRPGTLTTMSVKPMGSSTQRVRIPKSLKRTFVARGFDAAGVEVDIYPTWQRSGAIGNLSTLNGQRSRLDAAATPALGSITVTDPVTSVSTTTFIDVANITFTQSFNVYSDSGAGGQVGTDSQGGVINLSNPEHVPGDAPEGSKVMHATYTIADANAYAAWFVYEIDGSRFHNNYSDGYLHFWIRTARDLEISIRSNNIPAASNQAKLNLSDIGVPADNTWQEVWLALDDFKIRDGRLDFAQSKVFFSVAAVRNRIGDQTDQVFDVDDVRWFTADPHVPDLAKVYTGIKNKQNASTGLVLTFDNDAAKRAVTYDQALAAMAYTYQGDRDLAKKVLDVYNTKYNNGVGFDGFHEEYDRDVPATIRDRDRTVGPNAWIMLAALHYKAAADPNTTDYDAMINGIGTWIAGRQDAEGGIKFGYVWDGSSYVEANNKSTEHNFDVYAAFRSHQAIMGQTTFATAANRVYTWLTTSHLVGTGGAYNVAQGRFNVGETDNGTPNTDFALDAYSWAPLALSSYTSVVDLAEATFGATKVVQVNGFTMKGFDFSKRPGPPFGQPVDKDAVWIEGTAHMVLSYLAAGNQTKATEYSNELDKAVYTAGSSSQALTYASNPGTAYWPTFDMDATHAALSSMCWYYFAKNGFNPLQPAGMFGLVVKNISDNQPAASVTWNTSLPARWVRANQYIELRSQAINLKGWGVQIYTDNKNPALTPHFEDPTPGNTTNFDSNPAGLLEVLGGATATRYTLNMGWRIMDSTGPAPTAAQPYSLLTDSGDSSWLFFKDRGSPAMDANGDGDIVDTVDLKPFQPGDPYMSVVTHQGIQAVSERFFRVLSPDYIFLEADFTTAAAQMQYRTNIIVEYYLQ